MPNESPSSLSLNTFHQNSVRNGSTAVRFEVINDTSPLLRRNSSQLGMVGSSPNNRKMLLVSRRESCLNKMEPNDDVVAAHRVSGGPVPLRVGITAQREASDGTQLGQWVSVANQVPESLDYEEQENQMLEEVRAEKFGKTSPQVWKQWVIIVLIGCATAVVAFGVNEGINALVSWKRQAVLIYMNTDPTEASPVIEFTRPFLIYMFISLGYVLVAAALVIIGEPLAKGSGIAEIKCFLNGIRLSRVVRFKTLVCKAIGIMFSVASGLPCGKEGPMIHSGAVIASGLSTGKSTMLKMDTGFGKEFRSERYRRFFITAGASAGVAAAFGAPIGGLLFAVEEVASFWKVEMTVMVFCCSAVTPFVLQLLQDPASYGGGTIRGLIDFGVVSGGYTTTDLPFVALLGVCGGVLGAAFNSMNIKLAGFRRRFITNKWLQLLEVVFMSLLVSSVLMLLVLRGYTCVPVTDFGSNNTQLMLTNGCPSGSYNDMATYFFPNMEESISLLIHSEMRFNLASLVKQLVPYYFLTMANFGTMVPAGLFLPTLALGANFGHLYARIWNLVLPLDNQLDPAAYALFGATAILGGVVRMTISVIVIIMEATNNITFFYPLVIITVCAKFTGDFFNSGVYDMHIAFNKIPLLNSQLDKPELFLLRAKDVVNPRVVRTPVITRVGNLVNLLKAFPHHNVLVVEAESGLQPHFKGLLLRRNAIILVMKRAWEHMLDQDDFIQNAKERDLLCLKNAGTLDRLSESDMNQKIDLMPYIDQWPHTFTETAPLPRIHRTFRELGLRYIVVLDDNQHAIGVIARKQLTHLEFVDTSSLPPEEAFGVTLFRRKPVDASLVLTLQRSLRRVDHDDEEEEEEDQPSRMDEVRLNFYPEKHYRDVQAFLDACGGGSYQVHEELWEDAHREGIN